MPLEPGRPEYVLSTWKIFNKLFNLCEHQLLHLQDGENNTYLVQDEDIDSRKNNHTVLNI